MQHMKRQVEEQYITLLHAEHTHMRSKSSLLLCTKCPSCGHTDIDPPCPWRAGSHLLCTWKFCMWFPTKADRGGKIDGDRGRDEDPPKMPFHKLFNKFQENGTSSLKMEKIPVTPPHHLLPPLKGFIFLKSTFLSTVCAPRKSAITVLIVIVLIITVLVINYKKHGLPGQRGPGFQSEFCGSCGSF